MGDKSGIEWTDATWNPTTGCDRVSPGCAHCYALDYAPRLQKMAIEAAAKRGITLPSTAPYMRDGDPKTSGPGFGFQMHADRLEIPIRWTRPRRIFVNSMSDLFHPEMTAAFLAEIFAVMTIAKHHTFQVLTKRPEAMAAFLNSGRAWLEINAALWRRGHPVRPGGNLWDHPIPNVWLGTSVENARWRTRIDDLRRVPAAVRFLSCEPLLGPLMTPAPDTSIGYGPLDLTGIQWVIVGGESGPEHRPIDPRWVRDIRDECQRQDVAFLFKQWGGRRPKSGGRELDGQTWDEYPRPAGGAA